MARKPPAPSDVADKFMLRMPDGMRDEIAEAARSNGRSMNAEIIYRLTMSLADEQSKEGTTKAVFPPERQEMLEITAKWLNEMLAKGVIKRGDDQEEPK